MSDKEAGLREYGPGKFAWEVDAYVHEVSLSGGCDAEIGSVDGGTWYGLLRHGSTIWTDEDPDRDTLTEAERDLLDRSAGVIIAEDSYGFVTVEYFTSTPDLDARWAEIEEEEEEEDPTDEA